MTTRPVGELCAFLLLCSGYLQGLWASFVLSSCCVRVTTSPSSEPCALINFVCMTAKVKASELCVSSPKAASIERKAEDFELTDQGLLCRRVYAAADGEVQLRVAVPTGGTSWMEVPGVGAHEPKMSCLSIATVSSEDILVGIRSICDWKDWWPGMCRDIVLWCK